jgi:hypothetical protein
MAIVGYGNSCVNHDRPPLSPIRCTDFIVEEPLALSASAAPALSLITLRRRDRSRPRVAPTTVAHCTNWRRPGPRRFLRRRSAAMVVLLTH